MANEEEKAKKRFEQTGEGVSITRIPDRVNNFKKILKEDEKEAFGEDEPFKSEKEDGDA